MDQNSTEGDPPYHGKQGKKLYRVIPGFSTDSIPTLTVTPKTGGVFRISKKGKPKKNKKSKTQD